jgi:large subunit ribosomal protein L25
MVDLPAGAKPTIDRDFVICNISAPSALKSQEDEDEDEAEAAAAEDAAEEEAAEEV